MKKKFLTVAVLLWAATVFSASVELEWSVNNDKNIKEYKLSWWSENGVGVSQIINKGKSIRIDSLVEGRTYYFQITPIGQDGQYGEKSNIVTCRVEPPVVKQLIVKPELRIKRTSL